MPRKNEHYSPPLGARWKPSARLLLLSRASLRGSFGAAILAAFMLSAVVSANANILSWSGGSSTTANWSDNANWGFAGTPANGDTLVFPASQPRPTNTNNIAGLVLAEVRFAGPGGGYAIYGNAFTLTNRLAATNTSGANSISNSITLSSKDIPLEVASSATLTLAGQIAGAVGITKSGAGTLQLFGSTGNTYSGNTYVQAGTCLIDKAAGAAIPNGTLTIGDHLGAAAVVRDINVGANIGSAVTVVINEQGLLDLNGEIETVGSITLSGGSISTGAGRLQIYGDVTTLASANNANINGSVLFGGGLRTITVSRGSAPGGYDLQIPATISDTGNGIQFVVGVTNAISGTSYVRLMGSNYFTGPLTISGMTVSPESPWALGATNSGTFVTNGGNLFVFGNGITNESITLATGTRLTGQAGGQNPAWAGPIVLAGDATIYGFNFIGAFDILGAISGSGNLTVASEGELMRFSGSLANTFSGTTTVALGQLPAAWGTILLLNRTGSGNAIPGSLVINSNCVVRDLLDWQINSPIKSVTIQPTGLLDLTNHSDWIGPLSLQGAKITTGSGTIYLGGDVTTLGSTVAMSQISGNANLWNGTKAFNCLVSPFSPDLEISANLSGSPASGLIKEGDGELQLTGFNNTYPGSTTVNGGNLWLVRDNALGNTNTPATVNFTGSLTLSGGANIGLKPLTLNGPGNVFGTLVCGYGSSVWAGDVTFATNAIINVFSNEIYSCTLTLSGALGGAGGFTKKGPGMLVLAGPNNSSTYLGDTTVKEGILGLQSYNVLRHGTLTIGDGWGGANADVVRYFKDFAIYGGSGGVNVVILGTGLLDLNGFSDDVGPIALDCGRISTGAGILTLFPPLVSSWNQPTNSGWSIIQGNLALSATSNLFQVLSGVLAVEAAVSGPVGASLIKSGTYTMYLSGSNSYAGLTVVQQGSVAVENPFALGATTSGTVVSNEGLLSLVGDIGVTNETLTLNTTMGPAGGLASYNGTNIWAGPITVNGPCVLATWNPGDALRVIGPISGPGGVQMASIDPTGKLFLEGPVANTYAGDTVVPSGTLLLNKSAYDGAIPHGLSIGGTVRLLAANQIGDRADVQVSGGGLLDLGTVGDYIDTLHGNGTVSFGTGGYLGVGLYGGTSQFDGPMTGVGYAGGWTLSKWGGGTFTVTGNNTYSVGQTHVFGGKLVVNGSQPQSTVAVDSGATLAGSGIVGNILGNGAVAPGNSPGILTSSNVTFSASGAFNAELAGLTPGSGYDQLNVNGTVAVGNANLQLNMSVVGSTNAQFTIINNDGADAVTGTFASLPESGIVTASNGAKFQITYHGGSGNDVVLTQISLPTQPLFTGIRTLGGGIQLGGTGMTNLAYTVWANTNVTTTNWLNLGTATANVAGVLQFTDLTATNFPMRFYRFSWP